MEEVLDGAAPRGSGSDSDSEVDPDSLLAEVEAGDKWPWVKAQIVGPVNIRFNPTTEIGSNMGGAPTPKWCHWF